MLEFFSPWYGLLLPLPFLMRWKAEAPEIYFPAIERLKKAFTLRTKKREKLLFISWTFLILALMQPEKVDQWKQVTNKGYDLMLAVDISGSMQALDFSTSTKTMNRLEAAKGVVGKFVKAREGDRVGLITFGENAYLNAPLTLDRLAVTKMLSDTVVGMAGNGTAIGDAIGLAIRTLRSRPIGSRVLILLTDGEDNASSLPPLEAAKLAKQYGIRVYTIGIGRTGTDEELLKQISSLTEGHFFMATNQQALESIYQEIDQLEKSDATHAIHAIREPLYRIPLGLSAFILLYLTVRRRNAA